MLITCAYLVTVKLVHDFSTIGLRSLFRVQQYTALVASAPANSLLPYFCMGEDVCRFDYLQARRLRVLYIVGCGRARGIQWYQNHIHWTKLTLQSTNHAANSTRTDYSPNTRSSWAEHFLHVFTWQLHLLTNVKDSCCVNTF